MKEVKINEEMADIESFYIEVRSQRIVNVIKEIYDKENHGCF